MKKYIGTFGVDSGQVMLVDPCYLSSFENDDFQDIRVYQRVGVYSDDLDVRATLQYRKDFKLFSDIIPEWDRSMNDLITEGLYERINPEEIDDSFSYNGACNLTCYTDAMGGSLKNERGAEVAVVASTGYGDGGYDVYATYKEGRVKKLEVNFF